MSQFIPVQPFDLVQFSKDFFVQIASVNVAYLAISVGIIILFGGILGGSFFILGYKPFKKKLDEQDLVITDLKVTIHKIEEIEKRIITTETRINETENRMLEARLQAIWDQHYIWQASKIHSNDIRSLITYLDVAVDAGKDVTLCLKQIIFSLNSDPGTDVVSVKKMPLEQRMDNVGNLTNTFKKITGHEDVKKEILEKIGEKWFK